jgi:hypothetical protein
MSASRPPTPSEAISPGGLLDLPNAFSGPSWDLWRIALAVGSTESLASSYL